MKLSKTQLILLRLALECGTGGIFYPHSKQYLEGEGFIYINGSGIASSIRALLSKGLAESIPHLHPYAFSVTEQGRKAVAKARS